MVTQVASVFKSCLPLHLLSWKGSCPPRLSAHATGMATASQPPGCLMGREARRQALATSPLAEEL